MLTPAQNTSFRAKADAKVQQFSKTAKLLREKFRKNDKKYDNFDINQVK